jgi:ketosteroid isomerase-like protein
VIVSAAAPAQLSELYCTAFNASDLDAIVALYEPEALLTRPGREVRGIDSIREAFRETLARTTIARLRLDSVAEHRQGDLCLCVSRWTAELKHDRRCVSATTLEVCRRQTDGAWKLVIDDPTTLNPPVA